MFGGRVVFAARNTELLITQKTSLFSLFGGFDRSAKGAHFPWLKTQLLKIRIPHTDSNSGNGIKIIQQFIQFFNVEVYQHTNIPLGCIVSQKQE
jgi:hypothetical protein